MAAQLNIDTDPANVGDVYLIQKKSPFTEAQPNITLAGDEYISTKILTAKEMSNPDSALSAMLNSVYNTIPLIKDDAGLVQLVQTFRCPVVLLYCDPSDRELYSKCLQRLVELRKKHPLDIKVDKLGNPDLSPRDLLFALTD